MIETLKEHGSKLRGKVTKRDTYIFREVVKGFLFEGLGVLFL